MVSIPAGKAENAAGKAGKLENHRFFPALAGNTGISFWVL